MLHQARQSKCLAFRRDDLKFGSMFSGLSGSRFIAYGFLFPGPVFLAVRKTGQAPGSIFHRFSSGALEHDTLQRGMFQTRIRTVSMLRLWCMHSFGASDRAAKADRPHAAGTEQMDAGYQHDQ